MILIVEDEPKVASFIKQGLEESDFSAEIATDGQTGKKMIRSNHYEAVILDINIPNINGYDLCRQLRDLKINVPILMLTAMGTNEDKVSGFESGTDDYLVKPFEFNELILRLKALIRRAGHTQPLGNKLTIQDLEVNTDNKTAFRNGNEITLTAKEFMLLEYFIRNKGRVLSRSEIAEKIWEVTFDTGTNIIDVYVNFLRKKIDSEYPTKLIHTKIGMGYYMKEE